MGRRLPRRVWHTFAALVPLPVIGLGYVAAVPGNPIAFQIELYLAGNGSAQALTHRAATAPEALPRETVLLFRSGGKGPRADQYRAANAITSAGKQLITSSLIDPGATGALARRSEVNGASKGDRLNPTTSTATLRGSSAKPEDAFLMNAAFSPFAETLDLAAF